MLLDSLRAAGAAEQAAALAARLPAAGMFGLSSSSTTARISSGSGGSPAAPRPRHGTGMTWTYGLPLSCGGAGWRVRHPPGCPLLGNTPPPTSWRPSPSAAPPSIADGPDLLGEDLAGETALVMAGQPELAVSCCLADRPERPGAAVESLPHHGDPAPVPAVKIVWLLHVPAWQSRNSPDSVWL
jgi:hypothetical protein